MENENENLIFTADDPGQIDDMLRASQRAHAHISPEAERGYVKRSAETGTPVPLLRARDNRELDTHFDLSGLSFATKRLLLENPSLAIIARGEEEYLDTVMDISTTGNKSIEERRVEVEEAIRANGYTETQKQQLVAAGYQQLPSGKWRGPQVKGRKYNPWTSGMASAFDERRIEYVETDRPILPEWFSSPNERLAEPLKALMRDGVGGVIPEELQLQGVTEKDLAKALVADQTLMRGLTILYGTAWKEFDDENLSAAVKRVGTALKLDVENYDNSRIRKRGFGEYMDPMIFKDFLGLASLWKALSSDGNEMEKLTRTANNLDQATPEELRALNEYLLEQNRNMRGASTGVSLTEGILESGRFAGELFSTAGRSALTRGGTALLSRSATRHGILKTAGMALKDIAKGEFKRLKYYLPGLVGKELNESQALQAFIDDDGGIKSALSEKKADELAVGIANRVLETYIANFSERTGVFLDLAPLRKAVNAIPAPLLRSVIGKSVRDRFGEMTTAKWHTLYDSFLKKAGVSSVYGEYAEEKVGTFLQWASTTIAQSLDSRLGDFGVGEVFGTPSEEVALFGRVALTNGVFRTPGVVMGVRALGDTARFIDTEKALKTVFSRMENLNKSPEEIAKVYQTTRLPLKGHADPAKLRILAQSEDMTGILETLGIDQATLDRAENEGNLVEIPLDRAMGSLNEAQHTRLMDITTPSDVYSTSTGEFLREIKDKKLEEVVKEREEFTEAYNETLAQLSSLGRSTGEVRAAAKILGALADYFARESGMSAAEWIRNVAFKRMSEAEWAKEHEQGTPSRKVPRRGVTATREDINLDSFNDSWNATVVLFEGAADASTLVHEIEHYALHMMECLVEAGIATTRMESDLEALRKWGIAALGDPQEGFKKYVDKGGPLSFDEWFEEAVSENLAKGFERFVMEGEAPSAELVGAFSTLRRLMMGVYKSVAALGVPLSDDVRNVFSSMLASEREVEQSQELAEIVRELDTRFLSLTQDEKEAFQKIIDMRNEQAWQTLEEEKRHALKELRPLWRKEAQELVASDRTFSAWEEIVEAGGMDFSDLLEIAGEKDALTLRAKGLATASGRKVKSGEYPGAKPGVHPAVFAKEFDSVEEMVIALLESDSPRNFVEKYVADSENAFVTNFPLSDAALSVDAAAEFLEKLAVNLEKVSGQKGRVLRKEELRRRAEEELRELSVRDILNDRKAAKEQSSLVSSLMRAVGKNDYESAGEILATLRHKIEFLRFKADAKRRIQKADRIIRKGVKARQGKIEGPFKEALLEVATKFGFSERKGDFKGKVRAALLEFNVANPDVRMEAEWFDAAESTSFGNIPYAHVTPLLNLVTFLYEEGRAVVSRARADEREARAALEGSLIEDLRSHGGKHERAEDSVLDNTLPFLAHWGTKLRNIVGWASGWREDSPFKTLFYDAIMEAQSQGLNLAMGPKYAIKDALRSLAESSAKWDLDSIKDITFPEELRRRFKRYRKWDAEMVAMFCLNMGTAKNTQRIDAGFGWGDKAGEYRNRVAALLSENEWVQIQKIWDAISDPELVSRLKTTFRNIYHFDLELETPAELTITTSDGKTVTLKGGYLPKKYAYRPDNINAQGSSDPMREQSPLPEYRRASFTMDSRDEYDAPLDIVHSGSLISHVMDVAYYVTHAEVVRKIMPVVRSDAFAAEFKRRRGKPMYTALLKLLDNVARPNEWMEGQTALWEDMCRKASTALSLWGSFRTAVSQLSGATVGIEELKGYYWEALRYCVLKPKEAGEFIEKRSGFMKDRGEQFELDMKLLADTSLTGGAKRYVSKAKEFGKSATLYVDMAVARPLWLAAYQKSVDEGKDLVRAAAEADEFVAKTQGGSRPVDLSYVQLNAAGRLLTMFFSSSSAQATHTFAAVGKMIRDKRFDTKAIMFTLVAPRLTAALVSVLFAGSDRDDDDFFHEYLKELAFNSFSGIPLAEDAVRVLIEGDTSSLEKVPLFRAPAQIARSGRDALSSLLKGDVGRAAYRVAEVASIYYQIPAPVALDRIVRYVEDWTDEDLPGLMDLKQAAGIKKPNRKKE